jgi:hypothetical protein
VIEKWYKKEGDIIKKDEVICDIRTEVSIRLATLFNALMNKLHSRNEQATEASSSFSIQLQ